MSKIPIQLRKAKVEDYSFIINSFIKSYIDYLQKSRLTNECLNMLYYKYMPTVLANMFAACNVEIAVNPDDQDQFYGYIIHEKIEERNIVHYFYVKHTFRHLGIMTEMLNGLHGIKVITHPTRSVFAIKEKFGLLIDPMQSRRYYES